MSKSGGRKRTLASTGDKAKAERLAAALRANLKRRKAQARAKETNADAEPPEIPPKSGENSA
jgi:hypothetical protein